MTQNPLHKFFRNVKLYTTLPSGIAYYSDKIITFNDNHEVGVMPMTAKDEVSLKNPDALLNGEALANLISSCVPSVKQPKKLLANDVDALLIAIRHATYGDNIEITTACPKCDAENKYTIGISQTLASMDTLDDEYTVALENGITFYVRPFSYNETILALQVQFEQHKAAQEISSNKIAEDKRMKMFSDSFNEIVKKNAEILAKCIIKIEHAEDEIVVTEYKHIIDFLQNIDKSAFAEIDKVIQTINKIGVKNTFSASCTKCKHKWDAEINFNPVDFFTGS